MKKFHMYQIVIVNTGGDDYFGYVDIPITFKKQIGTDLFVYESNTKGYYWEEQDCYLIRFENGTRQYVQADYIRPINQKSQGE